MKFSFGSDPEFMLKNKTKYVSAINVVNGSIHDRINVQGHQFYWDNVLAECAIKPSYSKEETIENFREAIKIYSEIVAPCKLIVQSAQYYPDEALQDKRAKEAGCLADICAYLFQEMSGKNSPSDAIATTSLRTCGGHIHIGQDEGYIKNGDLKVFCLIYCLDLFLGIPSLYLDKDKNSSLRRKMYGQAGRFREKDYGFEYRSLSNFWLASPKLVGLVYDICEFLVDFVPSENCKELWSVDTSLYEELLDKFIEGEKVCPVDSVTCKLFDKKEIKLCIDNNNKRSSKKFLSVIQDFLSPELFKSLTEEMNNKKKYNFYKEWL